MWQNNLFSCYFKKYNILVLGVFSSEEQPSTEALNLHRDALSDWWSALSFVKYVSFSEKNKWERNISKTDVCFSVLLVWLPYRGIYSLWSITGRFPFSIQELNLCKINLQQQMKFCSAACLSADCPERLSEELLRAFSFSDFLCFCFYSEYLLLNFLHFLNFGASSSGIAHFPKRQCGSTCMLLGTGMLQGLPLAQLFSELLLVIAGAIR